MRDLHNFIDGAVAPAASGLRHDVYAPATGEKCGTIARSQGGDIHAAVRSAARAQPAWAAMRPIERARILMRISDYLRANADEFGAIEQLEAGKPAARVAGEIIRGSADYFEMYVG